MFSLQKSIDFLLFPPQKDSESDMDDSSEPPPHFPLQFTDNVKTETIDYALTQDLPKMETLPSILFEETNENRKFENDPFENENFKNETDNIDGENEFLHGGETEMEVDENQEKEESDVGNGGLKDPEMETDKTANENACVEDSCAVETEDVLKKTREVKEDDVSEKWLLLNNIIFKLYISYE